MFGKEKLWGTWFAEPTKLNLMPTGDQTTDPESRQPIDSKIPISQCQTHRSVTIEYGYVKWLAGKSSLRSQPSSFPDSARWLNGKRTCGWQWSRRVGERSL